MGGDNIPGFWSKTICMLLFNLFFLFAVFVLGVWVWIILGLMAVVGYAPSVTLGCFIFALTIAMGCALLWFGKQTEILAIPDSAEKKIWAVLFVAVIGTVAAGARLTVEPTPEVRTAEESR